MSVMNKVCNRARLGQFSTATLVSKLIESEVLYLQEQAKFVRKQKSTLSTHNIAAVLNIYEEKLVTVFWRESTGDESAWTRSNDVRCCLLVRLDRSFVKP